MKAGDYVRFKTLSKEIKIGKVIEIIEPDNSNEFIFNPTKKCNVYDLDNNEVTVDDYIIKSSPNIIELIEIGDYVNGVRVDEIKNGEIRTSSHYDGYICNLCVEEDIKSIVTKEMFADAKYRVETD